MYRYICIYILHIYIYILYYIYIYIGRPVKASCELPAVRCPVNCLLLGALLIASWWAPSWSALLIACC